ncbi:protein of unknown function [Caballeronia sp. S22]
MARFAITAPRNFDHIEYRPLDAKQERAGEGQPKRAEVRRRLGKEMNTFVSRAAPVALRAR